MLPPPKGGGFVVTDSSPVPSKARPEGSHPTRAERPPTRGGLEVPLLHTEVLGAWLPLVRDVLGDHLIRHVPAAATEVPTRPKVTAPELLPQRRELLQHLVRRLPLQALHQTADRHLRRDRDQQVHVILTDVALQDVHVMTPADLADQLPGTLAHGAH